jgi:hypothetical protein
MIQKVRLPDFIIVGTAKSGTTSLARFLNSHESVFLPRPELHYFNNDKNYKKGVMWYSNMLLKDIDKNADIHSILLGEKTPAYSYYTKCAERIKTTIPNVKLLWIFRDPVERSFSNYLHTRKKGAELLDFHTAITKEKKRIRKKKFVGYIERSKYVDQVEHFLNYFSFSQMHFMLFEDTMLSPSKELNKVADFLGISHFPPELPYYHSNPTVMPAWPFSLWLIRKIVGQNNRLYDMVRKINEVKPGTKPEMPRDISTKLQEYFKPYNRRLSKITGLDLSIWNDNYKT